MALRKETPADQTATAGAPFTPDNATPAGGFEAPEGSSNDASGAEQPAAAAAPAATTKAVTAPKSTAIVQKLPSDTTWAQLKNAIPIDEIESMGIGTFPRVTVDTGGYNIDKTKPIGKKIKVEVMSWNDVWLVTTGEQNNPEANKAIRSSYDGVNITSEGCTLNEYLKHLKEVEGYTKAEIKKQVEIYGNLLEFQEEDGEGNRKTVVVPVTEQKFVQVSLSPQSGQQWAGHLLQAKLRKMKGIDDGNVVVMTAVKKTLGSNTFGLSEFASV